MIAVRIYNKKDLKFAKRENFELVDLVCPCCEKEIKDIDLKNAKIILLRGFCVDCKLTNPILIEF